jgi:hypothetical protein
MQQLHSVNNDVSMQILKVGAISTQQYKSLQACITGYAQPLNRFLESSVVANVPNCMLNAMIAVLRASKYNCSVTDTPFHNFGVYQDSVRIIDMGSRDIAEDRVTYVKNMRYFFQKLAKKANHICSSETDKNKICRFLELYTKASGVQEAFISIESEWANNPTCRISSVSADVGSVNTEKIKPTADGNDGKGETIVAADAGSSDKEKHILAAKRYANHASGPDGLLYTEEQLKQYYGDTKTLEERLRLKQEVMDGVQILLESTDNII